MGTKMGKQISAGVYPSKFQSIDYYITNNRAIMEAADSFKLTKNTVLKRTNRAGTVQINTCGDSRLRGLQSRKPISFRQWVVRPKKLIVLSHGRPLTIYDAGGKLYECRGGNIHD